MDHLPNFKYKSEPYPRVPLLSSQPYDGLEFDGYQTRRGFLLTPLYNRDFSQKPREETADFLQTWLFYGAIRELLTVDEPPDLSLFIEMDDYGFRASTRHLERLISAWAVKIEALAKKSVEECRAQLTRVGVALNTINKIYHNLLIVPDSPLPWEVTLSFGVLGCTMDHALKDIFNLGRGRTWGLDSLAATRMAAAGWCPRDVAVAQEFLSELPMFCASFMERRTVPFDHWNCSSATCLLNNIDEKTYVTQHRTQGCRCHMVGVDQSEVHRIIEKGGIPVIWITNSGVDAYGSPMLDVKLKNGGLVMNSYIAISHVWSDGLGNPHANTLPLCQLQSLYDRLVDMSWNETLHVLNTTGQDIEYNGQTEKKIIEGIGKAFKFMAPGLKRVVDPIREYRKKPLAIWLDTFCVPLGGHNRKLAIANMAKIYSTAHMTIVLDSELQALEAKGCLDEELAMHIGLSGWQRRAWTFQEGALSTQWLRFLFRDGPAQLPLWKKENPDQSIALGYTMPGFVDGMERMQGKGLNLITKRLDGSPHYSRPDVPKSRLEEMERNKFTFALQSYTLEETKKFFIGMKLMWSGTHIYSHPDVLATRIIAIWETMRLRATSKESDKFICFAIMCALSGSQRQHLPALFSEDEHVRMRRWVQLQSIVPSGLLFIPGQRYDEPGFRWIPMGVYREPLVDDEYAERESEAEGGALLFSKPGWIMDDAPVRCLQDGMFVVSDSVTSLRYTVEQIDAPSKSSSFALVQGEAMAVILMCRVGERPPEEGDNIKELGALLRSVSQTPSRIRGDFVCRVRVGLCIESEGQSSAAPVPGRTIYGSQKWILG
ncbi:hypothetical protein D7B24_005548 [Verticillium nonalfalfae]|uniref:Heterokaryon incompatibility domain-containing protein n=1 Tax=Verticillium nonalfalfae TaxID=1051616 RepID=A0A3M9YD94_9PEZI|nr:uncharacterized protein D7B24_005548 [Verticillium nonalfalfae]RNJ57756.1 hypothetical protein D7B24_005548 [Verticillium nonalfalfae]